MQEVGTDLGGIGGTELGPPTVNKYRPPAGFMNEQLPDDGTQSMDAEQMLSKLRSRAGHWHQLAKYVPALLGKGYDSNAIDAVTGITPLEQSRWTVAGTVYDSIAGPGGLPQPLLDRFNDGGEELLYHFRFLGAERRLEAARFIVARNLDPQACEVLARSMKEWERRPSERRGFSDGPGDCLAFKYMRDVSFFCFFLFVVVCVFTRALQHTPKNCTAQQQPTKQTTQNQGDRVPLPRRRARQDQRGARRR